jgi:hypothetical protein
VTRKRSDGDREKQPPPDAVRVVVADVPQCRQGKRLDQGDVHSQIVRADEALAADTWTTRSVELPDGGRERRARELPVLLGHFS